MATIADLNTTAQGLKDRAKVFDAYAANQKEFDEAKTNLAKELASVADAISDSANVINAQANNNGGANGDNNGQPQNQTIQNPKNTTIDGLKVSTASVVAMQDALTGKVSVDDMSKVADNFDNGYDDLYQTVSQLNPTACAAFVTAYQNAHPVLFSAGSQIKNNSAALLKDTDKVMTGVSGWGGSYGDPQQAANKINQNVQNIAIGTAAFAKTLQSMTDSVFKAAGIKGEWISHYLEDGVNISINLGGAAACFTQAGASGIGSFYSARSGIEALKHGNIASASGMFASAVSGVMTTAAAVVSGVANARQIKQTWINDHGKATGFEPELDPISTNPSLTPQSSPVLQSPSQTTSSLPQETGSSSSPSGSSGSAGGGAAVDDYSADLISEINVILDGGSSGDISYCSINGVKYRLSGYNISQELLQPMILSFSIEKENKEETQQDVIFADATQIIGKSLEITVTTIKTSHDDKSASPQKAFVFKGMIIDVSAARATASAQSASITAATWDSLLQNAPHCRSFENLTLKEIVSKVIEPYKEITASVSPRLTDKIPYVVQYNQSDYAFIRMLAARFGEWMYNTGEKFIFGEMDDEGSATAKLEYPGGSLMSYNLNQNMYPFAYAHLLTDHYKYGSGDANKKKTGTNVADGNINDWTDKAYQASQQRFNKEHIVSLSSGGFDTGKEEEGATTILDYSVNIESQGAKTGLMTVSGSSKLAMLKIGQMFLISDNVQNRSGENKDVQQKALKIIGINHSFDYSQEYSNTFTAVPSSCKYPSYSDANLHAVAPSQRAKVVDNKDEQKLGRIRVQFPWQEAQDKEMKSPWLRIAVPYSGKEKGHLFIPEIDEEVMVGFEMDNAERPYIIGALYNGGEGKPDEKWAASESDVGTTNNIKAIRTRNGHTILFNDKGDAGLIEIYDNKNNTYHITLSADDKKITIYSAGDIEINADGSISMNAKDNVNIKANSNVLVNADKEVSIQASKVKVR